MLKNSWYFLGLMAIISSSLFSRESDEKTKIDLSIINPGPRLYDYFAPQVDTALIDIKQAILEHQLLVDEIVNKHHLSSKPAWNELISYMTPAQLERAQDLLNKDIERTSTVVGEATLQSSINFGFGAILAVAALVGYYTERRGLSVAQGLLGLFFIGLGRYWYTDTLAQHKDHLQRYKRLLEETQAELKKRHEVTAVE